MTDKEAKNVDGVSENTEKSFQNHGNQRVSLESPEIAF